MKCTSHPRWTSRRFSLIWFPCCTGEYHSLTDTATRGSIQGLTMSQSMDAHCKKLYMDVAPYQWNIAGVAVQAAELLRRVFSCCTGHGFHTLMDWGFKPGPHLM